MKFAKSSEQRGRVLTALGAMRQQLGLVLGAAQAARETAEAELERLRLEQRILRAGIAHADPEDLRHPALSSVQDRLNAVHTAFYAEASTVPGKLRQLVAESAPGAASAPPSDWLGRVGTGKLSVPPLWRIGSSTVDSSGPFPVAVPLLDESHLSITTAPKTRAAAEALVENLLLRVLSSMEPGAVRVHLWDIGQLTAVLPNLYPLSRTSAVTVYDPARLDDLLDELAGYIRRTHAQTMQAGHHSVRSMREALGQRTEPWRIAVFFGNGEDWSREQLRELRRIAGGALAAGISLIGVDLPTMFGGGVENIRLVDEQHAVTSMTGQDIVVDLDPPIPAVEVSAAASRLADALIAKQGGPRSFPDLLPAELGRESSARELRAPVGFYEGDPVEVVIGDATPHALIGGPSGSGKTNFLYALIGSLAARYPPSELALYLLDFKEGVSFAGLAPGRRDASWLPHARLIGVNVNTDREFGLALLRFLADELRRRSAAAKEHEVTDLAELRRQDPDGHWPRIVAVIDEFQYLFAGRDTVTNQATALLEDIARRGRAQGIHLILASQDIAGIDAFWGKPAVFEQCTLRIAMPKARRVLAETNNAAVAAPKWHAVVNHDSGVAHGNQLAHVPDASSRDVFSSLQRRLWELYSNEHERPRLFDGAHSPILEHVPAFAALSPGGRPQALLGQAIEVEEKACAVDLFGAPGRNLAVLGTAAAEALSILDSAAKSLGRQYRPNEVEFLVSCLVDRCMPAVEHLVQWLKGEGHLVSQPQEDELGACLQQLVEGPTGHPRILLLYGVDAALPVLEAKKPGELKSGLDHFRTVLKQGPTRDVHTLGWWRSTARLKDTLGFGSTDDIGAWAALDVQGSELSQFAAGQVVHWSPRPGRALFFDRSTHVSPEVMIPFDRPEF
ncbi:DNA polymerase III delta prime subunit [Amycolatopsis bartoniae]|uniref:Cell division protein FtsK n=1 Tax=Amycolatopsis bartoniae TaxID=941986 RepID=A0A8H9IX53_9PSEU|nr:FtsK/SpoIIIE domain-containing protein [Amycolatopsis bartoniae]MBB2933520.1 DNA polymerase III delta prime subunit [Amycolatopsis bartoniae]TVT07617.1 cell division protein FtsK [Amycolatopsis bartoniae]GHF60062.1 cell division protein FtsK [Amycolatopsis bartoniae]